MHRSLAVCFLALSLTACGGESADESVLGAESLTVDDIADRMVARFEANFEDVLFFTTTTADLEASYERDTADSLGAFTTEVAPRDPATPPTTPPQLATYLVPEALRLAHGLRQGAQLAGPTPHEGHRVYVLDAENPVALTAAPEASATALVGARLYIDSETFDVREIRFEVAGEDSSQAEPVVQRILYDDFQEVNGVVLPFTVRTVTSGLLSTLPDDYRMVMGGRLGLERAQAEQLPPGPQRDEALREIEAQERFLNEGILEDVLTVETVRINADGSS
ncbi:MAG: hypothetical protein HKN04_03310 [Rhodothermaceae bacterium]|nr:hypothetical protein [Rhodothermaceae bacterium]